MMLCQCHRWHMQAFAMSLWRIDQAQVDQVPDTAGIQDWVGRKR